MEGSWCKIPVSADQLSQSVETGLQINFEIRFVQSGAPEEVAIFLENQPGAGAQNLEFSAPHFIYFSPKAAACSQPLIAKFKGILCDAPAQFEVNFLAGDHQVYETLK